MATRWADVTIIDALGHAPLSVCGRTESLSSTATLIDLWIPFEAEHPIPVCPHCKGESTRDADDEADYCFECDGTGKQLGNGVTYWIPVHKIDSVREIDVEAAFQLIKSDRNRRVLPVRFGLGGHII